MNEGGSYWQKLTRRRISRRRTLLGLTTLGLGVTATAVMGCRGGPAGSSPTGTARDEGTPKPGGVWRQATITVAPHFSPYHRGAEGEVFQNNWRRTYTGYYDRLWGLRSTSDPARLVYLQLASSLEQIDELTVVAKMQQAFYQNQPQSKSNSKVNARQATAEDIAASFEFLKAGTVGEILPSAITTGIDLKSVTAVDRLTLRYDMFRPLAFFYESAAAGATSAYAIPKEMLDRETLMQDVPIGTGPFMFKSYQLGSIEEAVRNPNYFVKDRPYLDGKRLTFIPDDAAQEAAFRANQIDSSGFSNIRQRDSVAADLGNRITVVDIPGGGTHGISVMREEHFVDVADFFATVRERRSGSGGSCARTAELLIEPDVRLPSREPRVAHLHVPALYVGVDASVGVRSQQRHVIRVLLGQHQLESLGELLPLHGVDCTMNLVDNSIYFAVLKRSVLPEAARNCTHVRVIQRSGHGDIKVARLRPCFR